MAKMKAPRKKRKGMVKGAKIPSPSGPIPIPYPNVSQKKN
jgi:hypothetical protein